MDNKYVVMVMLFMILGGVASIALVKWLGPIGGVATFTLGMFAGQAVVRRRG